MKQPPITHLIIDTSSSNEYDNGQCDFCLIPMTASYISYVLGYMDEVRRLHRGDNGVYALKCWDAGHRYFQDNDKLQEIRNIDGELAADVQPGEPILLAADPDFNQDDYQRVDCQTVQISDDGVWWSAYVKHTGIRIESAQIHRKTLLRIHRSFGDDRKPHRRARSKPVHPAIRRIHDLLYLDMKSGREFYSADKHWDADTLDGIAKVVAEFIPIPPQIES